MSDPKSIQLKFIEWLSSKVSAAKLSELYIVCNDIESFCLERKILSDKLFETTDPKEIKRVISTIELRFSYKSNFNKMSSALRYYYNFLKEYSESTQHKKTNDYLQKNVILSTEHVAESQQKLTGEIQPKDNNTIDFNIKQDLTFTKPISFSYFGEEETVNNWTKLYTGVVAYLLDDYPHVLKKYLNQNIRGRGRYDFSDEDNMRLMAAPKKVADNFYLETNLSATDIISKIKQLLNICNVDYENLLIRFIYAKHKNEIKVPTSKTNVNTSFDFYEWLLKEQNMAENTCHSYLSAIKSAERFAYAYGCSSTKMLDVEAPIAEATAKELLQNTKFIEYNKLQHNRLRAAIMKLLTYLGIDFRIEKLIHTEISQQDNTDKFNVNCKPYIDIAVKYFPRGYRVNSSLEYKRFCCYYEKATGHEIELEQPQLEHLLQINGIRYDERIYMAETMLSDEMKDKLFSYIDQCFHEGKKVIYYEALFKKLSEELLDYNIYNENMLREYLSHMSDNKYIVGKSYISKEVYTDNDPTEYIRECLKEHVFPMDVEDLCKTLSHIPENKIKQILGANNEFARNSKGEYFHVDSLAITKQELNGIEELIQKAIQENMFISGNELFYSIKAKYPSLIEQNASFSPLGWRNALKYKLDKKFSFSGNIISSLGSNLTMSDCFEHFAKSRDSFTMDELLLFSENLGSIVYFDSIYIQSIRISKNEFTSKSNCFFNVQETDKTLDRYCTGDYISLSDVSEFGIFPDAFCPWNIYLLEQYVAFYSEKYELFHNNYNRNYAVGAIVKKKSSFKSFDDLVTDVLAKSNITLKKEEALEYLAKRGYIARRSCENIESLLLNAKSIRNKKEKN